MRIWGLGRVVATCLLAATAGLRARRAPPRAGLPCLHATVPGLAHVRFWGDEVPKDIYVFVQTHMPGVTADGRQDRSWRRAARSSSISPCPAAPTTAHSAQACSSAGRSAAIARIRGRHRRERRRADRALCFPRPSYDGQLAELWTTFDANSVATPQVLAGLLGAEALADSTPLRNLIAKHVDRRMLSQIAHEYRNGRLLLVGTTNLDAQRQVIWNMGEIAVAASAGPGSGRLFRDVLLASASLPGIFPPVHVKVRVGDQVYEEMHVDGGPTRQVFLAPAQFSLRTFDKLYPQPPIRRVFVVRNGKLAPYTRPSSPTRLPSARARSSP